MTEGQDIRGRQGILKAHFVFDHDGLIKREKASIVFVIETVTYLF
jgi:hypothetical protein